MISIPSSNDADVIFGARGAGAILSMETLDPIGPREEDRCHFFSPQIASQSRAKHEQ